MITIFKPSPPCLNFLFAAFNTLFFFLPSSSFHFVCSIALLPSLLTAQYVNVIKPPQHGTIPLDADERPVAIVTFKNSGCVETVMRSEFHYIDDRRLRVRQHTRCPHRVLAVISATPGAEGLPQVKFAFFSGCR